MNGSAIIVTGLPGSGKSNLGRALAEAMSFPYLDKDDFLEALFEEDGIGDQAWRRHSSLKADQHFRHAALELDAAVLVSHWQPMGVTHTGTPTPWLTDHFASVIEIYCECAPHIAAHRFVTRQRHAGHLDGERSDDEVLEWLERLAAHYPIHAGPVVRVSTEGDVSAADLAAMIKARYPQTRSSRA